MDSHHNSFPSQCHLGTGCLSSASASHMRFKALAYRYHFEPNGSGISQSFSLTVSCMSRHRACPGGPKVGIPARFKMFLAGCSASRSRRWLGGHHGRRITDERELRTKVRSCGRRHWKEKSRESQEGWMMGVGGQVRPRPNRFTDAQNRTAARYWSGRCFEKLFVKRLVGTSPPSRRSHI